MSRLLQRLISPSRIKADLLLVAGLHAFQKLVGFVVLALLARHFDPTTMGQLFFAMALALLLTMPTELGTHRYLARAIASDPAHAGRHLGAVVSLRLPLLLTTYALIAGTSWVVAPAIAPIVMLASLYTFLDSCYASLSYAFTALGRITHHVAMYAFGQVLLVALVTAAVFTGGSITTVQCGYVASHLALVAIAATAVRWRMGPIPIRFDPGSMLDLARDTLPFFALVFLEMLLFKIDTVLIWLLHSASEVARYESAYKFLEVSRSVVRPATLVFVPLCVQLAASGRWPQFRSLAARLVGASAGLGVAVAAIVIAAGGRVLPWFWGEAYADAVPVLRVLFLSVPAVFVAFISQILVTALRLERSAVLGVACAVAVNVVLNIAVIPRWGAMGAAWTTFASEILIAALLLRLVAGGIGERVQRLPGFEPVKGREPVPSR